MMVQNNNNNNNNTLVTPGTIDQGGGKMTLSPRYDIKRDRFLGDKPYTLIRYSAVARQSRSASYLPF